MRNELKSRMLRTNWSGWNHKWYAIVAVAFFAFVGLVLGDTFGAHLASSELGEGLMKWLFAGATLAIGVLMLAVIDMKMG